MIRGSRHDRSPGVRTPRRRGKFYLRVSPGDSPCRTSRARRSHHRHENRLRAVFGRNQSTGVVYVVAPGYRRFYAKKRFNFSNTVCAGTTRPIRNRSRVKEVCFGGFNNISTPRTEKTECRPLHFRHKFLPPRPSDAPPGTSPVTSPDRARATAVAVGEKKKNPSRRHDGEADPT